MKITTKDSLLIIGFESRIDTNNAPIAEKEILDAISDRNGREVVFDAENLQYISSAGLRVLMKARKTFDHPLNILNVSRDVYDILETTGFTELFHVKKAFRHMSVDGLEIIGNGLTGDVYRVDNETIIKVFRENVDFDRLIAKENEKARNAFVVGVPTAIPYDIVRVGNCYGTVYELLEAKELTNVIREDKEHLYDYIVSFAKAVKDIHTIHVDTGKFTSVKTESIGALPYLSSFMTEEQLQKIRAVYENIPDRDTFIHGDCHIGNVMQQNGELMFIDLSASGSGHPVFDLISMYSLFEDRADDPEAMAASAVLRHFTSAEAHKIWKVFLSSYLDSDDEDLLRKATQQISIVALARRLFLLIAMPGALSKEAADRMIQRITDYYDSGLESIVF